MTFYQECMAADDRVMEKSYANNVTSVLMPKDYEAPGNCSHCRRSDGVWKSLFSGTYIFQSIHLQNLALVIK